MSERRNSLSRRLVPLVIVMGGLAIAGCDRGSSTDPTQTGKGDANDQASSNVVGRTDNFKDPSNAAAPAPNTGDARSGTEVPAQSGRTTDQNLQSASEDKSAFEAQGETSTHGAAGGGIRNPTERNPAAAGENKLEAGTTQSRQIPRDTKGEVGSSYASNINPATDDRVPATGGGVSGPPSAGAPEAQIDVNRYTYQQRGEFKKFMEARLTAVNRGVDAAKASPEKSAEIGKLDKKRSEISSRLKDVDNVKQSEWDSFKRKFRDDVVALERQYQSTVASQSK